jgi:Asp-tRNA(Asn)/Glu-tRNA(Gln) amidotransferase A subunit family amidase
LSPQRLPLGMQVVGQRFADQELLSVARSIESALSAATIWPRNSLRIN